MLKSLLGLLVRTPSDRSVEPKAPQSGQADTPARPASSKGRPPARQLLSEDRIQKALDEFEPSKLASIKLFADAALSVVKPESAQGRKILSLAGPQLRATDILELTRAENIPHQWTHAAFKFMIAAKRLEDAELLIKYLIREKPDNGLYAYRLLDTLRRQGQIDEFEDALVSGMADSIQIFRLSDLFARIDTNRESLIQKIAKSSTTILLKILLSTPSESALHVVARRGLAKRKRHNIISSFSTAVAGEGSYRQDIQWIRAAQPLNMISPGLAAASLVASRQADGMSTAEIRRAKTYLRGVRAEQAPEPRCSLGWGVYDYREWNQNPSGQVPQELAVKPDCLLTFAKPRPSTEDFLSDLESDVEEIRFAPIDWDEVNHRKVTNVFEATEQPNSAGTLNSVLACRRAAKIIAAIICPENLGVAFSSEMRDVIALSIEDQIFPQYKRQMECVRLLKEREIKSVLMVVCDARVGPAFELAWLLDNHGISVSFTLDIETTREARKLAGFWETPGDTRQPAAVRLAAAYLGDGPGHALTDPTLIEPVASSTAGILVTTSLGDQGYALASASLAREISLRGHRLALFNGSRRGGERFSALVEPYEVEVSTVMSADMASQSKVRDAFRRLIFGLDFRSQSLSEFEPVFSNIWRLATTVVRALSNELESGEKLIKRVANGEFSCVVTVPGRMMAARTLSLAARRAGIPSVDVQAFFISANPRYMRSYAEVYLGITDDQIAVYAAREALIDQRIFRTGSLNISHQLKKLQTISDTNIREELLVPLKNKLIIYGAQHSQGASGDDVIDKVARAASRLADTTLIIKLHPRTTDVAAAETERRISEISGGDIRVVREGDIYAMIRWADLVITQFSNVGLEAAVLGVPALSINLTGEPYVIDLVAMGVADAATTPAEIVSKMKSLTADTTEARALKARREAYFVANPELRRTDVAERIVDLIEAKMADAVPLNPQD